MESSGHLKPPDPSLNLVSKTEIQIKEELLDKDGDLSELNTNIEQTPIKKENEEPNERPDSNMDSLSCKDLAALDSSFFTPIEMKSTVKEEPDKYPECEMDSLDFKDPEALNSSLYEGHEVKEDMVLGPTVVNKPILNNMDAVKKPKKKLKDYIVFDDENKENNSLIIKTGSKLLKKTVGRKTKRKNNKLDYDNVSLGVDLFCDYCKKSFKSRQILATHIQSHLKSIGYCKICNKMYKNKASLRVHKASYIHTGEFQKCKICFKTFTYKTNLAKHMKLVHVHEKSTFTCDICDHKFQRKDYLISHIRVMHPSVMASDQNNKTFTCICGKIYTDRFNCARHQKMCSHHCKVVKILFEPVEKFTCDICDKEFLNRSNFRQHKRYHRMKLRGTIVRVKSKYYCDFCSKVYNRKNNLVGHINKNHMSVSLPHCCKICNKKYALKTSFNNHLIMHTGKNPFCCKYCNLANYRSKWGLKLHEKKCSVNGSEDLSDSLGKSFRRNSNNTFTCTYQNCNRDFLLLRSYVRHWNRYHRNNSK